MKIGFQQFNINPTFPVNRMLREEKHQAVSDDLHCRIIAIWPDDDIPFYHVSIDTVELWKKREDQVTEVIEEVLGQKIHCICSVTHCHNCPCMTTDDAYVDFVLDVIRHGVGTIELKEYMDVRYLYQYEYFDKVGKSRVMDYTTPHVYAETLSLYGDGKRILTFLIHNVHPTTKDLWVDDFTAEYPGYCIEMLRREYPGEFFTFLLGPAGDTSPHFVRKGRDYAEMVRLAELLHQEFDRQLKLQKAEDAKPVSFRFEEAVIERSDMQVTMETLHIPEKLNSDEEAVLRQLNGEGPIRRKRELREFEHVQQYHLAHVILSEEYSLIFEPFELYSEYYGAVDKRRCSVISISHGFEHYLTGLYLPRLNVHGSLQPFSNDVRRRMWEIFGRWSRQEEV
ncbi:MAG: hypothetical protein LUG61_02945 [Lachnospiraceae bacterium]|nr:hypothetical protein [Lachnospiraceae bacterium]